MKYRYVKKRLNELLDEEIYSKKAIEIVKTKVFQKITKTFRETNSTKLGFDTTPFLNDIRQFHVDWQFQLNEVSTIDAFLEGSLETDIIGALGNFSLYAAIGHVKVSGDQYYKYDKKPYEFCYGPFVQVTHIYIYIKDNCSLNDEKELSKSQYLGHWNKKGMVLSYLRAISDFDNRLNMGNNGKFVQEKSTCDYMPNQTEIDKPVDTKRGILRRMRKKDVYYPVYNKSYNEWREKYNRGGDFMVYSRPQLYKLKKPITFKLKTVCCPAGII